MKIVLRLFAAVTAMLFVAVVTQIIPVALKGDLWTLASSGLNGMLLVAGWLLILAIAPPAVIRLWQLRRSGLALTASLFVMFAVYFVAFLVSPPDGAPRAAGVFPLLFNTASAVLLLSPAARRACQVADGPSSGGPAAAA